MGEWIAAGGHSFGMILTNELSIVERSIDRVERGGKPLSDLTRSVPLPASASTRTVAGHNFSKPNSQSVQSHEVWMT
ncbi:hypothetical protein V22_42820 [Calycomorphotria hydatis]|uniref:Uncharacterized protein n=1 Tax=Calycomorphotria hydatis TaxID=2528027 RepID=A0A517TF62_9PLAN|nr:hypothetical protein V22_42820 [Calycomorphotria hydatis]